MSVVHNTEHIIQLAVMVFLDFLVGTLLIIDLILTNKHIINLQLKKLQNEILLSTSKNEVSLQVK